MNETPYGPVEALPQTPAEVSVASECPEILPVASSKGITEIVHFTMLYNAIGIFATALKSRHRVGDDKYLEHVYRPNTVSRWRDAEWIDYVNLSVSRISDWMYRPSRRWHPDSEGAWVILSFQPDLLADRGVVFATTNNAYPECLRAIGLPGFERIFNETVIGYNGRIFNRQGLSPKFPTDRCAEVLYPGELSLDYLQRVYVESEGTIGHVVGALGALGRSIPVEICPGAFK